jgi:hypothetical protein
MYAGVGIVASGDFSGGLLRAHIRSLVPRSSGQTVRLFVLHHEGCLCYPSCRCFRLSKTHAV